MGEAALKIESPAVYDDGRFDDIDFGPYEGFASFIPTIVFNTLLNVKNSVILMCSGNRGGKTNLLSRKLVYSMMGMSPIEWHNITPATKCRIIRCAAETLPADREHEVRNTIYPAIKKHLPSTMIAKDSRGNPIDITMRDATITVNPLLGGAPGYFEFVSYGQSTQSQAGVDRFAINVDEVCSYEFYEECVPRLATTNGQLLVGCTPVDADWMYGEIYEKAKVVVRTDAVRKYMKDVMGLKVPTVERMSSMKDICVLQTASDDNPVFEVLLKEQKALVASGRLKKEDFPYETVAEYLDSRFMYDDQDAVAMRRYGIFRRVTGAMYKQFQWNVHVIEGQKYFPTGVPKSGIHVRTVDYHQANPWACLWLYLSVENECFAYMELAPDPKQWTTLAVCKEMAERSADYKFAFNLMDPLANETQSNTNKTVFDDFNLHFREMKRAGMGEGGHWEPWDTKGRTGQDRVRERLINSAICGRPLNNLQKKDGKEVRLPTLWVFSDCKEMAGSLKNWRQEQWASKDMEMTRDAKDKPEQKWSHFNRALEAALKDVRFRGQPHEYQSGWDRPAKQYAFQGRH